MRQTLFFTSTIFNYLGYRRTRIAPDGISEQAKSCLHLFGNSFNCTSLRNHQCALSSGITGRKTICLKVWYWLPLSSKAIGTGAFSV